VVLKLCLVEQRLHEVGIKCPMSCHFSIPVVYTKHTLNPTLHKSSHTESRFHSSQLVEGSYYILFGESLAYNPFIKGCIV
jgi:hypothetical protein